ncbi:hypothetical protein GCM10028895_16940 [Pontibacter rugosus]
MNDKIEFLKTVRPFDVLPEEVLAGVVGLLQEVRYTKDTAIYHQEVTKMKGWILLWKENTKHFSTIANRTSA